VSPFLPFIITVRCSLFADPTPLAGKHLTRSPVGNPENDQSAIEQFTYVGDIYDDLERCKLSIFSAIVREPLFDQLRAKEQLGYIVRLLSSISSRRY
jgi:secreted Zn-dependent insulinase-like peptidase